jgi:hypothetical protein
MGILPICRISHYIKYDWNKIKNNKMIMIIIMIKITTILLIIMTFPWIGMNQIRKKDDIQKQKFQVAFLHIRS